MLNALLPLPFSLGTAKWVHDDAMTSSETPLRSQPTFDLGSFEIPDRLPLSTRSAVAMAAIGLAIATVVAFTTGLVVVAILFVVVTVARLIARLRCRRRSPGASERFDDVR